MFIIGFIQDILGAYYLRLVNEQRLFFATFISFVHSIIGWLIFVWFMALFQNSEAMTGVQAFIYSVGSALGTYLGLRKPGKKIGA
jgi:hypothetical protein